jgi:hypothetical protein
LDDNAINIVSDLRAKGVSDNDIADSLMSQGYSAIQASEALNQANIMQDSDDVPTPASPSNEMRASVMDKNDKEKTLPQKHSEPIHYSQPEPHSINFEPRNDLMEEIAESVVNEKWRKFVENFGDFASWKDSVEIQLSAIKQEMLRMEQRFENLQKSVIGKVHDYDSNITEVGTEIKALQKVLQKILQPLSSNIRDLQKVTEDLKSR